MVQTLYECAKMGIPCLIQEQNSYAGVTNKLLSKRVKKICVAYEGMDRFFPADKIIMTGNPVRQNVLSTPLSVEESRESSVLPLTRRRSFSLVVVLEQELSIAQSLNTLISSNNQTFNSYGKRVSSIINRYWIR